ncbi:MAG TPA: hypothetical protein PLP42_11455 [Acidobacteriota bacterium]|nr:hypothetical protein [Acidobacteriota bacterium]
MTKTDLERSFGWNQVWMIALAVSLACGLAVIWLFRHLPLMDLPEYLLAAQTMVAAKTGDTRYTEFFAIELPTQPFATTYFWFTSALSPVLDADKATRLYLTIAVVGVIPAFAYWLRKVEPGWEVQALPATILMYGFFFQVGLLPFLFAMPFFFLALGVSIAITQAPRRRAILLTAWLSVLLLLVYFSHILPFGILLFVMGLQVMLWTGRRRVLFLFVAALPALLHLAWFLANNRVVNVSSFDWSYDFPLFHFTSVLLSFNLLYDPSSGVWRYQAETLVAWAIVLCAFVLAWRTGFRISPRLGAVCPIMVILWIGTPTQVAEGIFISFHFTYPLGFFLLAAAPSGWARKRLTLALVVAACLLAGGGELWRMAGFQAEGAELERAIDSIPEAQRLQPVITDLESDWFDNSAYLHAATWYNFRKGGTNPYSVAHIRHFPLKYRKHPFPKVPGEWHHSAFDYEIHGRGTDYFLVRTRDQRIIDQLASNVPFQGRFDRWLVFGPNPHP